MFFNFSVSVFKSEKTVARLVRKHLFSLSVSNSGFISTSEIYTVTVAEKTLNSKGKPYLSSSHKWGRKLSTKHLSDKYESKSERARGHFCLVALSHHLSPKPSPTALLSVCITFFRAVFAPRETSAMPFRLFFPSRVRNSRSRRLILSAFRSWTVVIGANPAPDNDTVSGGPLITELLY